MSDDAVTPPVPSRRWWRTLLGWTLAVAPLVGLGVLWARASTRSYYAAFFTPSGDVQGVAAHRGRVVLAVSTLNLGRERGLTALSDGLPVEEFEPLYFTVYEDLPAKRERFGFGIGHSAVTAAAPGMPPPATHSVVTAPIWFPVLLAAIPPLGLMRTSLRRRHRRRKGLCLQCGYDLRAAAGGRCPECGAAVPARP